MYASDSPNTGFTDAARLRPVIGAAATLLLMAAGIAFRTELAAWMRAHPPFFPLFVFAAQLLFVPRIVTLTLSGMLFPAPTAAAFTLMADTAAAAVVWSLGRWSFMRPAESLFTRPGPARVRQFLTRYAPLPSVAVLRILPVSHFSTVSLLGGALGIPFIPFAAGTIIGCLPTAVFWALAGSAL